MNDQMILVISSPSSSTIGFFTLIFVIWFLGRHVRSPQAPRLLGCWSPERGPATSALPVRATRGGGHGSVGGRADAIVAPSAGALRRRKAGRRGGCPANGVPRAGPYPDRLSASSTSH